MSATPYNKVNRSFSDKAHVCARMVAYPKFFRTLDIKYEEPTLAQDAQLGIDRIIRIASPGLQSTVTFLVQERFRRPDVAIYGDITLSEWLGNSNKPSELYSIKAQLFLFGRYDAASDTLVEYLFFWVQPVLHGLVTGSIPFTRKENQKQGKYFLAVPIQSLYNQKLVAFHQSDVKQRAA